MYWAIPAVLGREHDCALRKGLVAMLNASDREPASIVRHRYAVHLTP